LPPISEPALLEQARAELRSGDASAALTRVADHERMFPAGVLSEERDALEIEALVQLDRMADAQARWARFARSYPQSNYRPRLQHLLNARDRR
jgi:outer membrane protein assembly factor BamD (BamD/ComL family)